MLAPVVALIHRRSIGFHFYLDDCLVMVFNLTILPQLVQIAISFLAKPGFTVNWKESSPEPCQCLKFLGLNIDSLHSKVFFPEDTALNLTQCASLFVAPRYLPARLYMRFLSLIESALLVVPMAGVMMRPIQLYFFSCWKAKIHPLTKRVMILLSLIPYIHFRRTRTTHSRVSRFSPFFWS